MHSILIIGCGSIGERHLRCFQKTGRCKVSACDANAKLLTDVSQRYAVPAFASLQEALGAQRFDALVICTPAHTHLAIAREGAAHGAALLIEKPLSVTLDGIEETRSAIVHSGRFTAVAYVYHCFPWVAAARDFLLGGSLGAPLHASVASGQHFPTFRPAYREIYYTRHETGGGAIQDALTHLVNAMEWLIGPMTRVFCDASHQRLEGVTVEDTVNVTARHGNVLASYAMTQFQAPNETTLLIHCEHGSVKIESHAQRWGTMKLGDKDWTWHVTPPLERDELFIVQANAFLDGMEGKPCALSTFDEAVQTLRFNRTALESSTTGLPIDLP
ncbi:Gfo/Idh/MocA family oxidoreductase [Prosthecobacter sp.]|uniref:Gfo/Idh/MocA family protein n=1 Tax=Prosthecobacter sp. TaxID=1965333 RepID=UPI002ABA43BF|nr:Gfo/Idh/MocA family oxidoreductase [Prosthecobacter sp.]MDZ4402665.1 Gfo/Idh/MocA family oxidoreductase [Prosthecobacter sp.]